MHNSSLINMDDYENFDHEDISQYNISQEEELIVLLKSWNQEFLIEHFLAEGVYVNVLKVMKYHHIDKLLKKFDLGTQILFEHNLEEWRSSIGMPMMKNDVCVPGSSSPTLSATSEGITSSTNRYTPYPMSRPISPNTTPSITLSKILIESPKGVMLHEYYKKFSCFEDEQRTLLISTIAQFFQEKNEDMSLSTSYRLEREITETYPTEKLEYYRTNKRGKLYNKFSNLKTTFKSVSKFLTKSKTTTCNDYHEHQTFSRKHERIFVPEKDAESFVRMLKFDNLPCNEFDNCWKACSNYRLKQIKEAISIEDVFKKWPFFKGTNGYRLIDMDFNVLFKTGNQLLDKWELIAPKLLQFLSNNSHVKDKQIRSQLEFLKKGNITENTRDAILFWSLHGYFVPTNKTVKKNDSGKNNVIKFTIKDSQESFIFIGSCAQQIEEHLEFLRKSKNPIQPLILGLGDDIQNLKEIYVYFEGAKYIFTNFLKAVDICFKIFYVFNSYFPKQSLMFWNFFESYFYKIKNNNSFSKVHILSEALSRNVTVPVLSPGPLKNE